jgi:3-oxoacyl-[acyl-carrier protein] reductase
MKALVLGGTGAIGSAVVRHLAKRRVPTTFTYRSNEVKARALAAELGAPGEGRGISQRAVALDLTDLAAVRAFDVTGVTALVFCAASALSKESDDEIARALTVAVHAPLLLCRQLAGPANVVFTGALHAGQALPLSAPFAAAQGALGPLAMALAKELGAKDIRVNLVTGGLTNAGMSASIDAARVADYERFSALRRLGTCEEIAAPIAWLALDNTYVSGKVFPVNGGI